MESTIGARIRQLRETKGLSVADFAKAAGVKPSAVYGLESGQSKPSLETVAALRQSFPGLNTEWLQFGDGDMFSRTLSQLPPAVPSEAKPQREGFPVTPGTATPQEADFVGRYIKQLEQQLLAAESDKKHLQGVVTELLGKSPASAYAAVPEPTRFEVAGFLAPAATAPKEAKLLAMYPAPKKLAA